jgi:predicted TIM-barrel fold metal-dependent hydrolase
MGRAAGGAGDLGGVDNREIVEAVGQYRDRFLGFLGIDLENVDRGLGEVREYARAPNVKGISIEPGSARRPRWCDDASLDPIYEAALEFDMPVSISLSGLLSALGGHDITWSSPVSIQRVARKHPDLKIIVSHAAWPYAHEMVVVALASPNVYLSPDLYAATRAMICSDIYVQGANMFLEDRTLFGSAYPVRDVQDAVADFLQMGWRQEILPNLLWRNAARLLKIEA